MAQRRAAWAPVLLLLLLDVSSSATPPLVEVFSKGESGIACWRIPAIVDVTPAPRAQAAHGGTTGTAAGLAQRLLAFAEARIASCGDDELKMMALKSSDDGGATWSLPRFIVGDNATRSSKLNSVWNPEPVYDEQTGVVILAYLRNRTNCLARPGHCAAYQIRSPDGGEHWAPPQPLAPALGKFTNGIRPGPGPALQLTDGPHKGRLLFSGSYDQLPKAAGERTVDLVWWSDDGGRNFTLSPSRIYDGDESALVPNNIWTTLVHKKRTKTRISQL